MKDMLRWSFWEEGMNLRTSAICGENCHRLSLLAEGVGADGVLSPRLETDGYFDLRIPFSQLLGL